VKPAVGCPAEVTNALNNDLARGARPYRKHGLAAIRWRPFPAGREAQAGDKPDIKLLLGAVIPRLTVGSGRVQPNRQRR